MTYGVCINISLDSRGRVCLGLGLGYPVLINVNPTNMEKGVYAELKYII